MTPKKPEELGEVIPLRKRTERISTPLVGWIAGNKGTVPLIDFEGNESGPLPARSTVALGPEELLAAVASRQEAVILFEQDNPARPILVGLLLPTSETPLLDAVLGAPVHQIANTAQVDGERVVIEGRDEVVLQCGEASITLRRNGRISIRGIQLDTRARGLQRIRGGKVEIN